jgi:hypothetical protein
MTSIVSLPWPTGGVRRPVWRPGRGSLAPEHQPRPRLVAPRMTERGALPRSTRPMGDGHAVALISTDSTAVIVYDLQKGGVLWQHPCRSCSDIAVSDDGARLAQVGADGLEVWPPEPTSASFRKPVASGPGARQSPNLATETTLLRSRGRDDLGHAPGPTARGDARRREPPDGATYGTRVSWRRACRCSLTGVATRLVRY